MAPGSFEPGQRLVSSDVERDWIKNVWHPAEGAVNHGRKNHHGQAPALLPRKLQDVAVPFGDEMATGSALDRSIDCSPSNDGPEGRSPPLQRRTSRGSVERIHIPPSTGAILRPHRSPANHIWDEFAHRLGESDSSVRVVCDLRPGLDRLQLPQERLPLRAGQVGLSAATEDPPACERPSPPAGCACAGISRPGRGRMAPSPRCPRRRRR